MRNIAKRTLALVLSFVMILTSLPTIASADTNEPQPKKYELKWGEVQNDSDFWKALGFRESIDAKAYEILDEDLEAQVDDCDHVMKIKETKHGLWSSERGKLKSIKLEAANPGYEKIAVYSDYNKEQIKDIYEFTVLPDYTIELSLNERKAVECDGSSKLYSWNFVIDDCYSYEEVDTGFLDHTMYLTGKEEGTGYFRKSGLNEYLYKVVVTEERKSFVNVVDTDVLDEDVTVDLFKADDAKFDEEYQVKVSEVEATIAAATKENITSFVKEEFELNGYKYTLDTENSNVTVVDCSNVEGATVDYQIKVSPVYVKENDVDPESELIEVEVDEVKDVKLVLDNNKNMIYSIVTDEDDYNEYVELNIDEEKNVLIVTGLKAGKVEITINAYNKNKTDNNGNGNNGKNNNGKGNNGKGKEKPQKITKYTIIVSAAKEYTVEFYKDGEKVEADTTSVKVRNFDLDKYTDSIRNKYEGFEFAGSEEIKNEDKVVGYKFNYTEIKPVTEKVTLNHKLSYKEVGAYGRLVEKISEDKRFIKSTEVELTLDQIANMEDVLKNDDNHLSDYDYNGTYDVATKTIEYKAKKVEVQQRFGNTVWDRFQTVSVDYYNFKELNNFKTMSDKDIEDKFLTTPNKDGKTWAVDKIEKTVYGGDNSNPSCLVVKVTYKEVKEEKIKISYVAKDAFGRDYDIKKTIEVAKTDDVDKYIEEIDGYYYRSKDVNKWTGDVTFRYVKLYKEYEIKIGEYVDDIFLGYEIGFFEVKTIDVLSGKDVIKVKDYTTYRKVKGVKAGVAYFYEYGFDRYYKVTVNKPEANTITIKGTKNYMPGATIVANDEASMELVKKYLVDSIADSVYNQVETEEDKIIEKYKDEQMIKADQDDVEDALYNGKIVEKDGEYYLVTETAVEGAGDYNEYLFEIKLVGQSLDFETVKQDKTNKNLAEKQAINNAKTAVHEKYGMELELADENISVADDLANGSISAGTYPMTVYFDTKYGTIIVFGELEATWSSNRKRKTKPTNVIPDDPMPEAGPILNDLRTNRPNDSLTRSEFVAVLSQLFQVMDTGNYKDFNDIENDPNKAAIQKMSSFEIVKGYVDGSFGPNDFMTREQMYAILARAIKFSGKASALTDEQIASELAKVLDGENVSDWARVDVATAVEQGIVGADEVKALETITRAETADKLEKFIAVIAKEEDGAVVTTEIIE